MSSPVHNVLLNSVMNLYITILGLVSFLCITAVLRYWKLVRKYANFPSYSLLSYIVYCKVCRKIPKSMSFTNFVTHKFISVIKRHSKEGLCMVWIGEPILFIFNGDLSKIFSTEPAAVNKSKHYQVLRDGFGTGLVTSNGEAWKMNRKMLNPAFHIQQLKHKLPIFNRKAEILVKKLSEVTNDDPAAILHNFKLCTLSIVFESVLGLNFDDPEKVKRNEKFVQLIDDLADYTAIRMINPLFFYKFMLKCFPSGRKYLSIYKECQDSIEELALELKSSVISDTSSEADNDGLKNRSFARIVVERYLADSSYTFEDLKSEITTFMSAGSDTIAHTLRWCMYLLGKHPEVQEQTYLEVASLTKGHITYGDLQNMPYLECVIKESLRLYPPVPLYGRQISKDLQCGKYTVPKGTTIGLFPYMLHRDPSVYPNPEMFIPERFMQRNSETHPWVFTPFSEGIRNCIGKKMAMMELKVIISHVLQNYIVTSLDKIEETNLCWNIVLSPSKDLKMSFTPRK